MKAPIFKGWSTANVSPSNTNVNLYDIELVKQDLINEFMTRKGERVMMSDFGSITWDLLFEPMSDAVVSDIVDDSEKIVENDPRVSFISATVISMDNGITLNISANYIPTSTPFQLSVFFDSTSVNS